jgi:hypothetical protein
VLTHHDHRTGNDDLPSCGTLAPTQARCVQLGVPVEHGNRRSDAGGSDLPGNTGGLAFQPRPSAALSLNTAGRRWDEQDHPPTRATARRTTHGGPVQVDSNASGSLSSSPRIQLHRGLPTSLPKTRPFPILRGRNRQGHTSVFAEKRIYCRPRRPLTSLANRLRIAAQFLTVPSVLLPAAAGASRPARRLFTGHPFGRCAQTPNLVAFGPSVPRCRSVRRGSLLSFASITWLSHQSDNEALAVRTRAVRVSQSTGIHGEPADERSGSSAGPDAP